MEICEKVHKRLIMWLCWLQDFRGFEQWSFTKSERTGSANTDFVMLLMAFLNASSKVRIEVLLGHVADMGFVAYLSTLWSHTKNTWHILLDYLPRLLRVQIIWETCQGKAEWILLAKALSIFYFPFPPSTCLWVHMDFHQPNNYCRHKQTYSVMGLVLGYGSKSSVALKMPSIFLNRWKQCLPPWCGWGYVWGIRLQSCQTYLEAMGHMFE